MSSQPGNRMTIHLSCTSSASGPTRSRNTRSPTVRISSRRPPQLFIQQLPHLPHVLLRRTNVANRQTQRQLIVETRVRKQRPPTRIPASHNPFVKRVEIRHAFSLRTEADERERHGRQQFPIRRLVNQRRKQPRDPALLADACREAFVTEVTHHHP